MHHTATAPAIHGLPDSCAPRAALHPSIIAMHCLRQLHKISQVWLLKLPMHSQAESGQNTKRTQHAARSSASGKPTAWSRISRCDWALLTPVQACNIAVLATASWPSFVLLAQSVLFKLYLACAAAVLLWKCRSIACGS